MVKLNTDQIGQCREAPQTNSVESETFPWSGMNSNSTTKTIRLEIEENTQRMFNKITFFLIGGMTNFEIGRILMYVN